MSRRRLAGSKSSTTSTPRRPSCAPLAPEQRRRRPAGVEMKLKQLEGLLGGLTQFPAPKVLRHRRRVSPFFPVSCPILGSGGKAGEYLTFSFWRRC